MAAHETDADAENFPPRYDMAPTSAAPAPGVVVIKIGTSTVMRERGARDGARDGSLSSEAAAGLAADTGELALSTLALVVDTLVALRRAGRKVLLVSSGAVGVGCRELGVASRPRVQDPTNAAEKASVMATIQAYAAVGQSVLMRTYSDMLRVAGVPCAQVLLTSQDLGSEYQYENAKNTLKALLGMGVVPIVNENDTVATEEIKYGDNDWMSALVSTAVNAEWLFLLTDVDQLYSANPRDNVDARPIDVVPKIDELKLDTSSSQPGAGTQWGTGGMTTKITAARLATAAGVRVGLVHGRHPGRVLDFVHERSTKLGTVFEPKAVPLVGQREQWISQCLPPHGDLWLHKGDAEDLLLGKVRVVRTTSIARVVGLWTRNSAVRVCNESGAEIGRGLCGYGSGELNDFKDLDPRAMTRILGTPTNTVAIQRQDLAVFSTFASPVGGGPILASNGMTASVENISI